MAESKLVAQVIIDNGDAVAVSNATRDALVEAMAATERANKKIETSEEEVARALKTRLSASKEVDGAIRAQVAAGKPLEQELVQLSVLYQKLEAAMRLAAKTGGGVPASLSQEAARVRARMGAIEGQIQASTQASGLSIGALTGKVGGALSMFTAFGVGALTVGTSLRAMTGFLSSAVEEAAQAEATVTKLNTALESQGRLTDSNRKRILDYSTALQRQTAFGDEQITQIQTQLIMRGTLEGEALERATRNTLDMIAAGFGEEAAINAVSKAANGKLDTLNKLGIVIKATGDQSRDFEKAMKLVEERFGGQAAAELDTYEGKVKALDNAWGDFKEELGTQVLPVLKDLLDGLRLISNELTDDASEDGGMLFTVINAQANLFGVNLGDLLQKYKTFKQELDEDPNVAMLREREEAWKEAEAALLKMEGSSERNAADLVAQKSKVDDLYDAYTRLFMKQQEKGLGEFKGSFEPPASPEDVDEKAAAKAEEEAAAERKRAIAEALDRVKRKQGEATAAAKEWVDQLVAQRTAEDETALAILQLEQRNEALEAEIVAQIVANQGLNEEKLKEIEINAQLIRQHEDSAKAREKDANAMSAQEKRANDQSVANSERAAAAQALIYRNLGDSIATSMGTAFGSIISGERDAGRAVRQMSRDTAIAVINAAAAEAASKAVAAHAGIPFVGLAIGGAFAAAMIAAIFANKRFLAMAEGGELRGGIAGVDSIPILGMAGENMVDKGTNTRLKRMLDAFESGGVQTSARGGAGGGVFALTVNAPPTLLEKDSELVEKVRKALIPALEDLRETGNLDRIFGART